MLPKSAYSTVLLASVSGWATEGDEQDKKKELGGNVEQIPNEPPVKGGILSSKSETNLLPPRTPDTLPFDDHPSNGDSISFLPTSAELAQFLVDDALHILSSLSHNYTPEVTHSSSAFARMPNHIFNFVKSLSFLRSSSQEEPLSSSTDNKSEKLKKAMRLLRKAADSNNPDAIYLLGELSFVVHNIVESNYSMVIIHNQTTGKLSIGFRN